MLKSESQKAISLSVEYMAGLARGAKAGEGLSNAHLSRFSAFDGAHHCVGAFDDLEVAHTEHYLILWRHADGRRRNLS